MRLAYKINFEQAHRQIVNVKMFLSYEFHEEFEIIHPFSIKDAQKYYPRFFSFRCSQSNGEPLIFGPLSRGKWKIDFLASELKKQCQQIELVYEVSCPDFLPDRSHISQELAYLLFTDMLVRPNCEEIAEIDIDIDINPHWMRVNTNLKDISPDRFSFKYQASSLSELDQSFVLLGCHETDGYIQNNYETWLCLQRYDSKQSTLPFQKNTIEKSTQLIDSLLPLNQNKSILNFCHVYNELMDYPQAYFSQYAIIIHSRSSFAFADIKNIRLLICQYFTSQTLKNSSKSLDNLDMVLINTLGYLLAQFALIEVGSNTENDFYEQLLNDYNSYLLNGGRKFQDLGSASLNALDIDKRFQLDCPLKANLVLSWLFLEFDSRKDFFKFVKSSLNTFINEPSTTFVDSLLENLSAHIRDPFYWLLFDHQDPQIILSLDKKGVKVRQDRALSNALDTSIIVINSELIFEKVVLDGVADPVGINVGDVLTHVNGRKMQAIDLKLLNSMQPGKVIELTVRRNGLVYDYKVLSSKGLWGYSLIK